MGHADRMQLFFFFNPPAPPTFYTLSLHDALPISAGGRQIEHLEARMVRQPTARELALMNAAVVQRSEEHTSELQSRGHLVCRLLLEKKNRRKKQVPPQRRACNTDPRVLGLRPRDR